jgi:hypothetical protein
VAPDQEGVAGRIYPHGAGGLLYATAYPSDRAAQGLPICWGNGPGCHTPEDSRAPQGCADLEADEIAGYNLGYKL